jgi:hypothetical protein
MKTLTTTALVALVAGSIGFAALTPAAFAQQAPNPGQPGGQQMQGHMQMPGHFGQGMGRMRNARGPGGEGGLLALVCSDRGAERAEIGFVRLSHRLELSAEQQALFDDLKAAALTAQTQFADQCEKPAEPATADAEPAVPNPVERLTTRIANDTLRLDLMEGLLPRLEAFYDSLTDEQKASLQPQRGRDGQGFRMRRGDLEVQPGQPGQPSDPAAPGAAEPAAFLVG